MTESEEMFTFLRGRGVAEEVIHKMKADKVGNHYWPNLKFRGTLCRNHAVMYGGVVRVLTLNIKCLA